MCAKSISFYYLIMVSKTMLNFIRLKKLLFPDLRRKSHQIWGATYQIYQWQRNTQRTSIFYNLNWWIFLRSWLSWQFRCWWECIVLIWRITRIRWRKGNLIRYYLDRLKNNHIFYFWFSMILLRLFLWSSPNSLQRKGRNLLSFCCMTCEFRKWDLRADVPWILAYASEHIFSLLNFFHFLPLNSL